MASKINTFRLSAFVLALFFLVFTFAGKAQHEAPADTLAAAASAAPVTAHTEHNAPEKKVNIAEVAFEHILDSHSWHFWGEHEHAVSIPLPVILKTENGLVSFMSSAFNHDTHGKTVVEKNGMRFVNFEETIYLASETPNADGQYLTFETNAKGKQEVTNATVLDLSITKNVTQLLLSAILMLWLFTSIARTYKTVGVTSAPRGKQSFFEPLIVFVRDEIAKSNIGESKGEKFTPYLLTVFFLILINNVLGLIPVSANLTGNIAFTFVLATITLIVTNINGNLDYWKHIFLPKPLFLWIILMPIELIGIFTKPFALMIRLFANMTAGHIIIISLVGLIFIFNTIWISPVAVGFALFISILECLVAVLQAYIFTLLTALFIGSAMVEHHHEEGHGHDEEGALAKH